MQISFGQKIPVIKGQVFDKRHDRFIDAYLYELDCNDKSDIIYFKDNVDSDCKFYRSVLRGMKIKYKKLAEYNRKHDPLLKYIMNNKYYVLETKNNRMIGFCETYLDDHNLNIDFIESPKRNEYKYSGQLMLASLAKTILKNNKGDIIIDTPIPDSKAFYTDICGFEGSKWDLSLPYNKLKDFVKRTEDKTQRQILDIEV